MGLLLRRLLLLLPLGVCPCGVGLRAEGRLLRLGRLQRLGGEATRLVRLLVLLFTAAGGVKRSRSPPASSSAPRHLLVDLPQERVEA